MNIIMWVLAGAVIGWASYALLRFNECRGMIMSIIIGAAGGLFGGNVLGPLFSSPSVAAGVFDFAGLFIAASSAAASLTIGDLLYKRFGV